MKTRVLTGIAILIPSVYLIGWSPKWLFLAVLVVLVERGLHEYILIVRQTGFNILPVVMYVSGAAVCMVRWPDLYDHGILLWVLSWLLLLLIPLWALRRTPDCLLPVRGDLCGRYFCIFHRAGIGSEVNVSPDFTQKDLGGRLGRIGRKRDPGVGLCQMLLARKEWGNHSPACIPGGSRGPDGGPGGIRPEAGSAPEGFGCASAGAWRAPGSSR